MTEEQQFRAVLSLLGRMEGEVSGRIALDPELDSRLRLLADGLVENEREQEQLLAAIAKDESALTRLAEYLQ